MPLVEIKGFNALVENKLFLISHKKQTRSIRKAH